ncbi:MAG TPA: hypothetical protein VGB77_15995 [Abditibacteriaceae bacterium]
MHPALLSVIALVALIIVWLVILSSIFKQQAHSINRFYAIEPSTLDWIDLTHLNALTADLEAQGFVRVLDLTARQMPANSPPDDLSPSNFSSNSTQSDSPFATTTHQQLPTSPAGQAPPPIPDPFTLPRYTEPKQNVRAFGRIFVHPKHGCAANILAARGETPGGAGSIVKCLPLQVAIVTLWDGGDDYWVYATTSHKADPFSELHRHDHSLFQRRPQAGADELLQLHLQTVPLLDQKIPQKQFPFRSAQDYMHYEEVSARKIRSIYTKKNALQATLQLATFSFRSHDHYWGALEGQIPL